VRHVVGKLKHLHRLKYKLADMSAGKLSTPETWARDTGSSTGYPLSYNRTRKCRALGRGQS